MSSSDLGAVEGGRDGGDGGGGGGGRGGVTIGSNHGIVHFLVNRGADGRGPQHGQVSPTAVQPNSKGLSTERSTPVREGSKATLQNTGVGDLKGAWDKEWEKEFASSYIQLHTHVAKTTGRQTYTVRCMVCGHGGLGRQIVGVKCTIKKHIQSTTHLRKVGEMEKRQMSTESLATLLKNNKDKYFKGDVSEEQANKFVSRAEIARAFLQQGIPFHCLRKPDNQLRCLLEKGSNDTGFDCGNVSATIPLVRDHEIEEVKREIRDCEEKRFTLIFDGTTDGLELMVFVVRFVSKDGLICHRVASFKCYSGSLTGFELSQCVYAVNSLFHGATAAYAGRDGASVNTAALREFNAAVTGIFKIADIQCLAHAVNTIGSIMREQLPLASKLVKKWSRLVVDSHLVRGKFKELTREGTRRCSNVRWFADYDVASQMLRCWIACLKCVEMDNTANKETRKSINDLLEIEDHGAVRLQLAIMVDGMAPLVTVIHILEGDGFLAPLAYDIWHDWVVTDEHFSWANHDALTVEVARRNVAKAHRLKAWEHACALVRTRDAKKLTKKMQAAENLFNSDRSEWKNAEERSRPGKRKKTRTEKGAEYAGGADPTDMEVDENEDVDTAPMKTDKKYEVTHVDEALPPEPSMINIPEAEWPSATHADVLNEMNEHSHAQRQEIVNPVFNKANMLSVRDDTDNRSGRLAPTLEVLKACRLLNFDHVANTNIRTLEEELNLLDHLCIVTTEMTKQNLLKELVHYQEAAKTFRAELLRNDEVIAITQKGKRLTFSIKQKTYFTADAMWQFWQRYKGLRSWHRVAMEVALIPTSSASSERAFSIHTGRENKNQKSSLPDKREATVMISHNYQKRSMEKKLHDLVLKGFSDVVEVDSDDEEVYHHNDDDGDSDSDSDS